ncbi:pirin family protein [Thalassotalea atypica]|uniref:pirin family protein n=1 Tax=Thalassotalea atypica TaxID=2054316 RepID=UPI0025745B84|nr:pirin family protein [Thalassotalea atypica]
MTRQIIEIRNGRKHGPVSSFVAATNIEELNPFVLWDHFYLPQVEGTAGFDFHGHSGVATISYPQVGDIAHEDTGGHSGLLKAGGIQIMSSGAGVLHKETVFPDKKHADAFQLWVALPEKDLEMGPVTYSTLQEQNIPVIEANGSVVKVLVGEYQGQKSAAQPPVDMSYFHIKLEADSTWAYVSQELHTTAFIYVRKGMIETGGVRLSVGEFGIYENQPELISVNALNQNAEFLVVTGAPLKQPIISNGASLHSSNINLIAGVQKIRQLHTNGIRQIS